MSTYQKRFLNKINEISTASYTEMKAFIVANKLAIRKNLAAGEMRKQIIDTILTERKAKVAAKAAAAAIREEKAREEAAAVNETTNKIIENIVEYFELSNEIAEFESKERRSSRRYFTTFEMELWNTAEKKTETTLFSFISAKKNPTEEALARFKKWIIEQPNFKGYPDQFKAMKQLGSMNVPIKSKREREAFEAIGGTYYGEERAAKAEQITKMLKQIKYKNVLYHEFNRIDGFPDVIDKHDGRCVPNFLVEDMKYKPQDVKAWFDGFYAEDPVYKAFGFENHKFTCGDLVEFANAKQHSYYLLDRTNFCFDYNVVEGSHSRTLYAMIEGAHLYPITAKSARDSIREKVKAIRNCVSGAIRDSCVASNGAEEVRSTKIDAHVEKVSEDMLFDEVVNSKGYIERTLKHCDYVQTSGKNLNDVVGWFTKRGYIPSVEYSSNGVDRVSFTSYPNVLTRVSLNNEWNELDGTSYSTQSGMAFSKFDKLRTEHPEIIGCAYGGVATPKYWIGCEITPETHYGLDFNKYYYNCALRLEDKIPVFSIGSKRKCDKFVDDGSFYYVLTNDQRLFRGCDYYTCEVIRLAVEDGIQFTIDHKLVPSDSYSPDLIKAKLNEIVEDFGDINRAKKALVRFIGMLARNKSTRTEACLISAREDNTSSLLYHYLTELSRGKDVQVHIGAFPDANMIVSSKKKAHSVSAGSAHRAIINRSYIEMYKFLKQNELWDFVDGIKTDCVLLSKSAVSVERITELLAGAAIPMKLETPKACSKSDLDVISEENAFVFREKKVAVKKESDYMEEYWNNATFPTESEYPWMDIILHDIIHDIELRKFIRIEGIAGAGKSFIARLIDSYFRYRGFKVMKLASDWVAANNIGGKTFHTQFVLGDTSDCWFKNITCKDLSNTVVIIDEVSKLDKNLIALVDYIRTRAFAVIVMGDCEHQLLPVKKSAISVEESLNEFVDASYLLEVCKRGKDIMEAALKVFHGTDSVSAGYHHQTYHTDEYLVDKFVSGGYERLICKSNAVRNAFNKSMVDHIIADAGADLETREISMETNISVSEKKTITTKVFVGMKLVSICNNKKLGLTKADVGVVSCLMPFTVDMGNKTIVFAERKGLSLNSQIAKAFNIGYAITCYKSQSATYSFRYMITDWEKMDERERFVAITRATQKNNITIAKHI